MTSPLAIAAIAGIAPATPARSGASGGGAEFLAVTAALAIEALPPPVLNGPILAETMIAGPMPAAGGTVLPTLPVQHGDPTIDAMMADDAPVPSMPPVDAAPISPVVRSPAKGDDTGPARNPQLATIDGDAMAPSCVLRPGAELDGGAPLVESRTPIQPDPLAWSRPPVSASVPRRLPTDALPLVAGLEPDAGVSPSPPMPLDRPTAAASDERTLAIPAVPVTTPISEAVAAALSAAPDKPVRSPERLPIEPMPVERLERVPEQRNRPVTVAPQPVVVTPPSDLPQGEPSGAVTSELARAKAEQPIDSAPQPALAAMPIPPLEQPTPGVERSGDALPAPKPVATVQARDLATIDPIATPSVAALMPAKPEPAAALPATPVALRAPTTTGPASDERVAADLDPRRPIERVPPQPAGIEPTPLVPSNEAPIVGLPRPAGALPSQAVVVPIAPRPATLVTPLPLDRPRTVSRLAAPGGLPVDRLSPLPSIAPAQPSPTPPPAAGAVSSPVFTPPPAAPSVAAIPPVVIVQQAVATPTTEVPVLPAAPAPADTRIAAAVTGRMAMPAVAPGPVTQPAHRAFARALFDASRPTLIQPAGEPSLAAVLGQVAVTPAAPIQAVAVQTPINLAQPGWPHAMVDRIELLRDRVDAGDTRIRLIPDALGSIEVAVRTVGDTVHVQFTAAEAPTRQILTEAQPQLAQIAEERGLRLGQSAVAGGGTASGTAGGGQPDNRPAPRATPTPLAPPRAVADEPTQSTDTRIG